MDLNNELEIEIQRRKIYQFETFSAVIFFLGLFHQLPLLTSSNDILNEYSLPVLMVDKLEVFITPLC